MTAKTKSNKKKQLTYNLLNLARCYITGQTTLRLRILLLLLLPHVWLNNERAPRRHLLKRRLVLRELTRRHLTAVLVRYSALLLRYVPIVALNRPGHRGHIHLRTRLTARRPRGSWSAICRLPRWFAFRFRRSH